MQLVLYPFVSFDSYVSYDSFLEYGKNYTNYVYAEMYVNGERRPTSGTKDTGSIDFEASDINENGIIDINQLINEIDNLNIDYIILNATLIPDNEFIQVLNNYLNIEDITEESFRKYLYQDLPDVDLLIRTSGELRLSNFMMYQASYAEFYFPKVYFPDFTVEEFDKAIIEFNKRNRRFGGVKK